MLRQCSRSRLTRIEVFVIAGLGLFLLATLPLACRKARTDAGEAVCARNLALLGQAMFIYAGDYDGKLPRSGTLDSEWGMTCWDAPDRYDAYGLAPNTGQGGRASIGSCLYLLVKYTDVSPATFICPTDPAAREFTLSEYAEDYPNLTLADIWDFGPDSGKHYSYAYHIPFCQYALNMSDDPGLAVLADRNPWLMGKLFERFEPDIPPYQGAAEQATAGNTICHNGTGQNVLFLDGHVDFHERAYCGLDNDNIYTVSARPERGDPKGHLVKIGGGASSAHARDSLLIQDPTAYTCRTSTTQQALNVDSSDLEATKVLATLDCPVPSGRNAIWCATFQMAWDRFREEFVGEPILVPDAEELANRLNGATFPKEDIEEESYYATAGTVANGILEEIQREMTRRFPTAAPSVLDELRQVAPDLIAFAYLSIDMAFTHPFRANERPFTFTGSDGTQTDVSSFSDFREKDEEADQVREQVEILHYGYGDTPDSDTFAVDLCKQIEPYQIVLARMPIGGTLRETVAVVERAITAFKDDPDYETLRQLRPIDRLTVPDVLYKLTHHFRELEGKELGNPSLRDMPIVLALQRIDFSLSRTGVVLRSTGIFGASRNRSAQIAKPRYLDFDRPFLIYLKKRQPNAHPFFVMWVDNAELLKPH